MSARRRHPAGDGAPQASGWYAEAKAYVPRILPEILAARPGREAPWLDTVEGTLVMADVSGFTAMSERLASKGKEGAERLTAIICAFFTTMLDIARADGGVTMTFGGDAMLILFAGPGHAGRAARASLAMLDATARHPAFDVAGRRIRLGMSMGGHTGLFTLAAVGMPGHRMQFVILGPGTAATARAEAAAQSLEYAVTPEAASALAEAAPPAATGPVLEPRDGLSIVRELGWAPPYPDAADPPEPTAELLADLCPFLPMRVAAALRGGGPVHAAESEHRKVATVFVNVTGTDTLAARSGTEALLDQLQTVAESVTRLADTLGGFVVSNDIYTDGFKFVVTFGAPVSLDHDTANALRFASDLTCELAEAALDLEHRTGVNVGGVFSGEVGSPWRRQYTVMGDAVNVAARLMSAAVSRETIVSRAAADEAGPGFDVAAREPIRVKGKSEPIAIGTLVGTCDDDAVPDEGLRDTPFVGRKAELDAIYERAAAAEAGVASVVAVTGDPGIGKTRLLREATADLATSGWSVHAAAGVWHAASTPFAPWRRLLRSILGIDGAAPAADQASSVAQAVATLCPAQAEATGLLGPLLDLPLHESDLVRSLGDRARRRRLFDLVAALAGAACERAPVVLVIDDAQWADAGSRELAVHVTRACRYCRLLLLIAQRTEGATDLDTDPAVTTAVALTELDAEESAAVLLAVLGRDSLAPAVLRALVTKARGNPLFIEQVAGSVVEAGILNALDTESEAAVRRRIDDLEIPERLQGLIMARFDALDDASREVLRVGSVIGTGFDTATLDALLDGDAEPVGTGAGLTALVRERMLTRAGPDASYEFRHNVIREVVYEALPYARRRALHERAGLWIERTHERLEPVYETLAHHFGAADDAPRTARYAVKAARKARRAYALDDALAFYRTAGGAVHARTADAAAVRSFVDERCGDCLDLLGRHEEAADVYREALGRWRRSGRHTAALELSPPVVRAVARARGLTPGEAADGYRLALSALRPGPRTARGRALMQERLADLLELAGEGTQGAALYRDALASWVSASGAGDGGVTAPLLDLVDVAALPAREALLCEKIGRSLEHSHRAYGRSLRWIDRALESLPPRSVTARAKIRSSKCAALYRQGRYAEALKWGAKALADARSAAEPRYEADALTNMAACCFDMGDLARAVRYDAHALELRQRIGDVPGQATSQASLGASYYRLGDIVSALEHSEAALAIDRRVGDAEGQAFDHMNIGEILVLRGDYTEAAEHFQSALALAERTGGSPMFHGFALMNLARARMESGAMADAQETAAEAVRRFDEAEARGLAAEARIVHGWALLEAGRLDEAEKVCETAGSATDELGMRVIQTRVDTLRGRLAARRGDHEAAEQLLWDAADHAGELGADHERGLALLALGEACAMSEDTDRERGLVALREACGLLQTAGATADLARATALADALTRASDRDAPPR